MIRSIIPDSIKRRKSPPIIFQTEMMHFVLAAVNNSYKCIQEYQSDHDRDRLALAD